MKTEIDSNGTEVYLPDDTDIVPASVRQVKPKIYKEGDAFCCLQGANLTEGVFGCGATPELAMQDWDRAYQEKKDLLRHCKND